MTMGLRQIAAGAFLLVGCVAAGAYLTQSKWRGWYEHVSGAFQRQSVNHSESEYWGHDRSGHDHGSEDSKPVLTLSAQARENLGLQMIQVKVTDYWRTIQIPGIVAEQQGHSERRIPATVSGIVTKLHIFPGQSVQPGDDLMDIQPTGELLTTAQSTLLRNLKDIELLDIELNRITPLVENGSLPAKNKIEKEYERKRLESLQLVQTQELLVRGLSPEQIRTIVESKTLIRQFTVRVPGAVQQAVKVDRHADNSPGAPELPVGQIGPAKATAADRIYSVERIAVFPGKLVQPGEELVELALHTVLDVTGQAFERESPLILRTLQEGWPISASFETADGSPLTRDNLKIRYLESTVDGLSRIQKFHIPLVNQVPSDLPP